MEKNEALLIMLDLDSCGKNKERIGRKKPIAIIKKTCTGKKKKFQRGTRNGKITLTIPMYAFKIHNMRVDRLRFSLYFFVKPTQQK